MKQIRFIAAIAAAVALLAACTKETDAPKLGEGTELTITASYAENRAKTTLQDGGTDVYWEPGDEIKVFLDGESGRFASTISEVAEISKFKGSLSAVIGGGEGYFGDNNLFGLYPYRADAISDGASITTTLPSEQTGRAGSFAKNTNITIALSNTTSLGFYNVCGGVRFSVTRDDVKNVVFEPINGESVAGKVKLAFEEGVPAVQEIVEGVDSIALTAPAGGAFEVGKWYYIVALPGTLSGGFKMTFNTETKYAVLKSTDSRIIKRSKFGSLADADDGLIYKDKDTPEPTGDDYVDLGLSVKWATCNIGSDSPEEYGTYFAWGDVVGQTWNGSEWSGGGFSAYHEYELDENNNLKPEYDAARVNLGGSWRMPTQGEQQELIDNCTSTWTSDYEGTGVAGRIFTSNKEGYTDKSIFLPAAGIGVNNGLLNAGYYGTYWPISFGDIWWWSSHDSAYVLYFLSDFIGCAGDDCSKGQSVRPVYGEYIPVTSITLDAEDISFDRLTTRQLETSCEPENASRFNLIWSSSDNAVATISSDGLVTAVGAGQCTITARVGTIKTECTVTVTLPELTYVDLGLSVKWATCNIGSDSPEEYGTYFAWGDVVGQTWNGSEWSGGGFFTYPTYELDENNNLKPEYDAAHINLGGSWRMPTQAEQQELINNCTSTWTSDYEGTGVAGRIFTSNKEGYTDKSIFLPAAGSARFSPLGGEGSYGYYWSGTFNGGLAWSLGFDSAHVFTSYYYRDHGSPVRPVTD